MKVFLDDERDAPKGWTHVRWPNEAIALLLTQTVTELSLDHDLGNDARGTGYDVIRWIEARVVGDERFVPPYMVVHSANPAARLRMLQGVAVINRICEARRERGRSSGRHNPALLPHEVAYSALMVSSEHFTQFALAPSVSVSNVPKSEKPSTELDIVAPPSMNSSPTLSFSTLAKLMGPCTPVKVASLLRGHKYPTDGPKRSYQNARAQAIDHLVRQVPLSPQSLRDHERDALVAFAASGYALPSGVSAARPSPHRPHWVYSGVEISVFPDVELISTTGTGALKIHFNKEPLPRGVGAAMAALIHYHQTNILGQTNALPRHCLVYEARTGATYSCGSTTKLLGNVQAACQLAVAL